MEQAVTQAQAPEPIDDGGPADTANTSWLNPKNTPTGVSPRDLRNWREAVDDARTFAVKNGLSKSEVARRADVPMGTFSPWYDGKYPGNVPDVTRRVQNWLDAERERETSRRRPIDEPGFVETPIARRVNDALVYAQSAPAIALVTLGSGMGKTTVARRYCQSRPHAYRIVLRPSVSSAHSVLVEIARVLNVRGSSTSYLTGAIGDRLRRNGRHTLLIVDEAQNLKDVAFDELRHFLDEYGCGLALLGNDEVHNRWGRAEPREGYGQLHRRIAFRIRELKPSKRDIETYIDAWGLEDPAVRPLLAAIGRKPGALGQISETIRFAAQLAIAQDRAPNADDIRRAWENRGGEALR